MTEKVTALNKEDTMIVFVKKILDMYVRAAASIPMPTPMIWTL